jgi:hypothetical protein
MGMCKNRLGIEVPVALLFLATNLAFAPSSCGQNAGSSQPVPQFDGNARELVQQMVQNELNAQLHDRSRWQFRDDKIEDGKPEQLTEVVQTNDGDIRHILATSGQPLTPEQEEAENARIESLISNPDRLQEVQKQRHEDAEHERRLLAMLPEAFCYDSAGTENGIVTLNFHPNEEFRSSQREERVFHHMEGVLRIDLQQKRLVELSGRLTSEVKFGGGLFGRLDPGGTFDVTQRDIGDGHWDVTHVDVHINGKALLFKDINVKQKETRSDFQAIPGNLTLQQGFDLLERDATTYTKVSTVQKPPNRMLVRGSAFVPHKP